MLQQSQYNAKWGEIEIRPSKRGGIEIMAMNHERARRVSVGTVRGQVFEKGNAAILRQPEPSFCLSNSELSAAKEAGALFVRMITPDKKTYSIGIEDFKNNGERYYNALYGEQTRCALRYFQFANTSKPRNASTDNPVIAGGEMTLPIHKPSQPSLFDISRLG